MSNLEIMQSGIDYTIERFFNERRDNPKYAGLSDSELEREGVVRSGQLLEAIINGKDVYAKYTRQNNLRRDMQSLKADDIKNELLKNIVNVAVLHRMNGTRAANETSESIRTGISDDQISVIVFNNMQRHGVEKGYELLNDPNILSSACRSFAWYRRKNDLTKWRGMLNNGDDTFTQVYEKNPMREQLDIVANTHPDAVTINNELDVYYARYGDRQHSNPNSYGYDGNAGYSGFGRR